MIRGSAYWTYYPDTKVWYFGLNERAQPPYRKQIIVEAILDLDSEGHLAGVEIIDSQPDGKPIEPPLRASGRK